MSTHDIAGILQTAVTFVVVLFIVAHIIEGVKQWKSKR